MNRFKNILLVITALSLVVLAIGQYQTRRVIAGSVPVVQVTKWEYKVDSCTGPNLHCANFMLAGLQGWELVTVSRGPEKGTQFTWEFVFKRPKL